MEVKDSMTIKELESIMIEHGLVIRAIPYERQSVLEVRHKDTYPDGIIKYREDLKRDMLHVTESNGNLGGKFLIEKVRGRDSMVRFSLKRGKQSYDTLQEAIEEALQV